MRDVWEPDIQANVTASPFTGEQTMETQILVSTPLAPRIDVSFLIKTGTTGTACAVLYEERRA